MIKYEDPDAVWRHGKLSVHGKHFSRNEILDFPLKFPVICLIVRTVRIDSHKDPFFVCLALKDQLTVHDQDIAVCAIAQGITLLSKSDQLTDVRCQFIWFRSLKTRPKCVVIIRRLDPLFAPFASIINARYTRHGKECAINRTKVFTALQDAGDPCDIVIIHKSHEMFTAVDAPLFRSELTVQGVCDLE